MKKKNKKRKYKLIFYTLGIFLIFFLLTWGPEVYICGIYFNLLFVAIICFPIGIIIYFISRKIIKERKSSSDGLPQKNKKQKHKFFFYTLWIFLILSILTWGPTIIIHGKLYRLLAERQSEQYYFVSPYFYGDYYDVEIPFVISFYCAINYHKYILLNFWTPRSSSESVRQKIGDLYLDEIRGVKITKMIYHAVDGTTYDFSHNFPVEIKDEDVQIKFGKSVCDGDMLNIVGFCNLKNNSTINFNYKYKVKITPARIKFSLRILKFRRIITIAG